MERINIDERRARLAQRHHLANPGASATTVAGGQVGLHSSDPATVFLSLRARLAGFAIEDLEAVLYEERTLVRILGMRRTMFVVPIDLAGVMDAACTQAMVAGQEQRLARVVEKAGWATDGMAWVNQVEADTLAALARRGPSTARELTEDVPDLARKFTYAEDKSYGGVVGISTRILFLLATRGDILRGRPLGSWLSTQYRWALTEEWLGQALTFPPTETARAELARRWLQTYGPGTLTDLKWWSGWNLGDTRTALADIGAVEVELDNGIGYILADDTQATDPPPPWASLLPALDPTPMGWKERDWFLGQDAAQLYDRNGNIGPTIWANGRIVGGWSQDSSGSVQYRIIESITSDELDLIEREAEQVDDWLGDTVVKPRFGTPLDKELRQL